MLFSDNTSTVSNTRGFALGKGTNNGVFLWNYENTEMVFATNGSERMRIASNGNIGIGTNATPTNSLTGSSILAVGSIGYGISGEHGIYIGDSTIYARWKISHGDANLNLLQNNGSGTYNYRGAFANSTGAYSSVSDKRLKKLIEPIQYGLDDVLKFKPVSYFMENQNEDIDKRNLGFIAQDLEDIIPEIVNVPSTSNAVYSLQYSSIIPILIKAVQELNDKIISLKNTSNVM
jgi:trimeric autotransporter adhesin